MLFLKKKLGMRFVIFLSLFVAMCSCKFIDDKTYGPLKPEAKQYIPLLTDTIVAHNPDVIKFIYFDTTALTLKVVYDGELGDVSEIDLTIEGLDLLAPKINTDSLQQVNQEQLAQEKLEKQEQIVKDFVKQQVGDDEIARLDSVRKYREEVDSTAVLIDSVVVEEIDSIN